MSFDSESGARCLRIECAAGLGIDYVVRTRTLLITTCKQRHENEIYANTTGPDWTARSAASDLGSTVYIVRFYIMHN